MKYLKLTAIALTIAVLSIATAGTDQTTYAQTPSLVPQDINIVDGANPGEVIVSWDEVDGAKYYRVGWVQPLELDAVVAAGRPWTDAFYFVDVQSPATSRTVTRLVPGAEYYFLVGGLASQYGTPQWNLDELEPLTLQSPGPTPGDYDAADRMMKSAHDAWNVETLFTVGERVGGNIDGYRPPGIFDGMGALPAEDGKMTVLVNHELNPGLGEPYTLANGATLTSARISKFLINPATLEVEEGGLAYDTVIDRYGDTITPAKVAAAAESGDSLDLLRFCSAYLVRAGEYGMEDDIYLTGEEARNGQLFALDIAKETLHAVPAAGRASYENVALIDTGDPNTIGMVIGDHRYPAPLLLYIGQKDTSEGAGFLERNGLAQGKLYVWKDNSGRTGTDRSKTGATASGSFVEIQHLDSSKAGTDGYDKIGYAYLNTQDALVKAAGALMFAGPEDLAVNPENSQQFVIVSTRSGGRTYIVDVNPSTLSANIKTLYAGNDAGAGQFTGGYDFGLRGPDNLIWANDGYIYIQEDSPGLGGASGREASVWQIDPDDGQLTRIAEMNRNAVLPIGAYDTRPDQMGNWESSGVIDVTEFFPDASGTVLLLNVQAHSVRGDLYGGEDIRRELVEGGQILLLHQFSMAPPTVTSGDYDADNDGLIEITTLAQLDAIRYDLDGNGLGSLADQHYVSYTQAFTNAAHDMGCPSDGCHGYELAADLDFDTNANGQADAGDEYWNDGKGWAPIGHVDDAGTSFRFAATFNGNSHTISNLHINRPEETVVGLFGITDFGNVIKSVNLASVNVTGSANVGALAGVNRGGAISNSSVSGSVSGTADDIGGLVGDNRNGSTIANSHSTASVSGNREVGGLVGFNLGSTISNSSASGSASGTAYEIGGLVGDHSEGGVITDSHSTAAVSGNRRVGGLVGHMKRSSNIIRSHAAGDVTGNGDYAGGLVGRVSLSTIIASYANGDVTGNGNYAGGLVGDNLGGAIFASYAAGSVSGAGSDDDAIGGLVGQNGGRIYLSYATGSVSGSGGGADRIGGLIGQNNDDAHIYFSYARGRVSETTGSSDAQVGGLVGENYADAAHVVDSYWDTQTSGQTTSDGGDGKTTADLQTPTANTGIYQNWSADRWDYGTASQYPVLFMYGLTPDIQR